MTAAGPKCPIVVRVFAKEVRDATTHAWVIGAARPDGFPGQIMRMFVSDEGVDVYVNSRGDAGEETFGRVLLPLERVCSVEEQMTGEVFVRELLAAEEAAEGVDDEDEDETADSGAAPTRPPAVARAGNHA